MAPYYYRLRVRNAADTADALVVTSVPSGTNPYISAPPSGDGQGFNPRTGATEVGAYTFRVADNGSAANAITGFLSDGNGRYDKLGRRAYGEYGTDGTTFPNLLVAGYVTALSYPSAAEAMVAIGEAQRTERVKQAFSVASTNFPATTMLAGGPVRWPTGVNVTPINYPDRGPWTVKVQANDTTNHIVSLLFVSGWVLASADASDYARAESGAFPPYMRKRLNALTATEQLGTALPGGFQEYGNVYADVYQNGSFVATVRVLGYFGQFGDEAGAPQWINVSGAFNLEWTTTAVAGDLYQVYVYSRSINESSPLHLLMHPVDIVTGLIADAGELWDATSAAAVRASIGADVRFFGRFTQSETTEAAITRFMGAFGFGRRMNGANQWEFFDPRSKGTAAPATTITLDDLREMPTDVWALEDSTILNTITVVAQRFAIWAPGQSTTRPADSLVPVEQRRTARFQLADGTYPDAAQGTKEVTYTLPGTVLNAAGAEIDLTAFTSAIAAPAFDRWGYGAPSSGLVLRTSIAAQIGDEVLLNLGYLPNASVRGGQRIVQLVQRTNEAGGPVVRVEDSGTSAQPALAPTFTIAQSVLNPRASADVTLTNAAALATAGVQSVLVEWIVSATAPTVAGQDLGAIIPATPTVLTTPQAAAGSIVWARAKSIQPGRRAGAFTAWASVTLGGVGAPSALAFTANGSDGSAGVVGWTAGANSSSFAVRILRRPSALSASADVPVATLLPGSVAAALSSMTPGASYTATVQYVDATTGTVAASATLTFTAGTSTATLAVPASPVGIVGSTDRLGVEHIDGTYGLNVMAVEFPGTVEFWEAVETAVGSGTYGTASPVSAAPSVNGGPTTYRNLAPNDKLRRSLTARHVRLGTTASAFTAAVVVSPWGTIAAPPVVGGPIAPIPVLDWATADTSDLVAALALSVTPGTTPTASLTYTLTQKLGKAAPVTLDSGSCTALPKTVTVPRVPRQVGWYVLTVTDPLTGTRTSRVPVGDDGRDGARGGGSAIARTGDDESRSGMGGVPTPGQRINTRHQYDTTGATPLIDAATGRITTALGYPGGTGIDALRPAEAGANVTETRTANDTSNVGARPAATVRDDARFRGPRHAGHAIADVVTDDGRSGVGGMPTPGGRVHAVPQYDATGATPLIDPVTQTIQPGLAIGPNVRGDASVAFGGTVKYTPNRHNERVVGRNEDIGGKTFSASFDNIPEVKPLLETFTIPGTNSTLARRFEVKATNVSVSGFTPRAVYTTGPTNVAKSEQFSPTLNGTRQATNALSAQGAACYCDLSQANSTSTTYNVKYDVNTVGMSSVLLRVQVYKNRGSSGVNETTWDLVGTQTYDTGLSLTGEVISFTAVLGLDFDVRVVLSYTTTPASTGTVTVKTCDYNAVTAGTESSLTPDSDSAITFMAVEKS